MAPKKNKTLHPSEALLASVSDPGGTMDRLLAGNNRPPHTMLTTGLFLSVCIAPPLVLNGIHSGVGFDRELFGCVAMTTIITLILVSLFSALSVHAIGVRRVHRRTVAALAYSLAPITMVMVIMAIINRIVQGSFSILVFIAYGFSVPGDLLVSIFPHVFRGALILSVITLAFGFRTITRGTLAMGAVMATLALVLLLGSYIIGLTATELVYPFSSARTIEFFSRYFAYPR